MLAELRPDGGSAKPMARGPVDGGGEQCPCLYRFITVEDQVSSGLVPVARDVRRGWGVVFPTKEERAQATTDT